ITALIEPCPLSKNRIAPMKRSPIVETSESRTIGTAIIRAWPENKLKTPIHTKERTKPAA
ncbi:MAG: hypothetical protein WBA54_06725, partial [Acidaminobacteraceae bacterium]